MEWKAFFSELTTQLEMRQGVSESEIVKAETKLGIGFPKELRTLFAQTNGIYYADAYMDIVWTIERMVQDNLEFRKNLDFQNLYSPFDHLLFFADAGNGDQFAFRIFPTRIDQNIYVWNHEDDSRTWVAPSLRVFLQRSIEGKITT